MYYPNQYFGQPQYGVIPQQQPRAKFTQPLTAEMINKLRSTGDSFEVKVSQEDLWRAACTHKENGNPTLISEGVNPETGNEILRCTICGESFEMTDVDNKHVEDAVNLLLNLLQTSKTMYLDAPAKLVEQYYQMIPLLKMFPKLYERSQKNFSMYENALGMVPGQTAVGANGFQIMGAMLSGNPYAGMAYQPPMAPQPWAQPVAPQMMPQQPVQPQYVAQPQMWGGGYQQQPNFQNPLMYGAAQVAPAPQPAPAAGVMPTAPSADPSTEVHQQKQFNV